MSTKPEDITIARTKLLLNHPWFGSLALRLRIETSDTIPTAGVDGVTLYYNPEWFNKLNRQEQIGIVAHEVMHCALLHPMRLGHRDPVLANIAMDYAINYELKSNGFSLPQGALIEDSFKDMEYERIYEILKKNAKTLKVKTAVASFSNGGNFGDVMKSPSSGKGEKDKDGNAVPSPTELEQEWRVAVEQATISAQRAGKLPASLQRKMESIKQSKTCWQDVLKRYISRIGDYAWCSPNRRYVSRGMYIPGCIKTKMSSLVIAVDTSGSIDQKMLNDFASEINSIFDTEVCPEVVYIIYCDASVNRVDVIENDFVSLSPVGGGGTAFQPVFDYVEKNDIKPECLIYLTDLESSDKPKAPGYDVLFVVPSWASAKEPFGERVYMDGVEK